ncbi:MAG: hypothetical protein WC352_02885 [Candidatus Omnitrophota bacterium]
MKSEIARTTASAVLEVKRTFGDVFAGGLAADNGPGLMSPESPR